MSAFQNYYLISVEENLGRTATEAEIAIAKSLYNKGWHPARTADHLKFDMAVTGSGLYNCEVCGEEKCILPGICDDCQKPPDTDLL